MDKSLTFHKTISQIGGCPTGDVHSLPPSPGSDIPVFYQQALALHQQNRFCEAESLYRQILDAEPNHPGAHHFFGMSRYSQGYSAEAIGHLERSLRLCSTKPVYFNNYGVVLKELKRFRDAKDAFEKALILNPDYADALSNLGLMSISLDEPDHVAEYHLRAALRLQPNHRDALRHLTGLLWKNERHDDAIPLVERRVALDPDNAELVHQLGCLYGEVGEIEKAKHHLQKASSLPGGKAVWKWKHLWYCPTFFENEDEINTYWNRLNADLDAALAEQSLYNWRTLVYDGFTHSFNLPHLDRCCKAVLEKFASLFAPSFPFERPTYRPGEKIRVGFLVTPGHEGGFLRLCTGLMEQLDAEKFEIALIYNEATQDGYENRFQRPDLVHVRYSEDFEQAVRTIRSAQCDVIYYWKVGADVWNFFLPMCRLAPIQCTSWSTQGTSGVPHVDYYVSWDKAEHSKSQDDYTEQLFLLQTSPLDEPIPQDIPKKPSTRKELGLPEEGTLYFCPHKMPKYHPKFDAYFREILQRDSNGHLLILQGRSRELNQLLAQRIQLSLGTELSKRVIFIPQQHYLDYYRYLSAATVVLHSPVFSGEITSIDGFLYGIPYVTQTGAILVQRYSSAFYEHMGIEGLAVPDKESYVEQAVQLGVDAEYRQRVSRTILENRHRIFENPLTVREWERFFTEVVSHEPRSAKLPMTRPGENQAVPVNNLDINVAYGCNLRCGYCTHFCSWMSGTVSVGELMDTFRAWHHKILPERLLVVGGEPLLHPELETILPELHRYWPNSRIDLLTNGMLFPKRPNILPLLKDLNGYVHISRHFQDEPYLLEFEESLECLRKSGVAYSIVPSDSDWRKYYMTDGDGHAVPYDSDPEKAWRNCRTKNGCPSLLENKLYKCAHMAYAALGTRLGFLPQQWQVVNRYQPLDATCSSREILSLLSTEAVEQCRICPESYDLISLSEKYSFPTSAVKPDFTAS